MRIRSRCRPGVICSWFDGHGRRLQHFDNSIIIDQLQHFSTAVSCMKRAIKISTIPIPSELNNPGPAMVTHRLRPRKKQEEEQTKSLSIGQKSVMSTNELLSSISTKLHPRSISVSTDSKLAGIATEKIEIKISCLDRLQVPHFELRTKSQNVLQLEQLQKSYHRRKMKAIALTSPCFSKNKRWCSDGMCPVKQRWKNKLVLSFKDSKEAENLKNYVSSCQQELIYDNQINKDVPRSFPSDRMAPKAGLTLYHTGTEKSALLDSLGTVLKMLAVSDPQVGYVQGMNLLSASIISHMKEVEPSFLFIKEVMRYGNMRKMYISNFKEMRQLCSHMLHRHIKILMADLYEGFMEAGVVKEMFMSFYLSMFANVMDYQYMHCVVDEFMTRGFLFLDKLMLSMLCYLRSDLLSCDRAEMACKLGASYIKSCQIPWADVINLTQAFELN